jgi:hypothetical protein
MPAKNLGAIMDRVVTRADKKIKRRGTRILVSERNGLD